ncbi:SPOR domain-containing protein [Novosphingobium bradum]|uniref:SPOR domain-containing protein n=1 Tax=Novosphingobium bradum TaxID=1737444 RepID=A0ABV7IT41_9SPHN
MDQRDGQGEHHPFDPPADEPRVGALAADGLPPAEVLEGAAPQLALDEDERLPWLESADDDDDDEGTLDTARVLRVLVFGLILLAGIGGALWFMGHRGPAGPEVADGGVIKAPAQPYKQVPADQGGKTYAGTGDSAFAVSEGKTQQARLGGHEAPAPAPSVNIAGEQAAPTGVGVQVGAYTSQAAAEAGWTRLAGSSEALKAVKHRVIQGTADIGTVYRLQAVAPDPAAANALCSTLKSSGIACQVKG